MKKKPGPAGKHTCSSQCVEQGSIVKKGKGLIKIALVYPNTYAAGMSSLGFQTVYKIINEIDFLACERVFVPEKNSSPKSIETGLSLEKFDIIIFSISFENDFLNLVTLLGKAALPLRSPDRNHIHPLVAAGGVACFLNPEPIADFIDCFLLGEAECFLDKFLYAYSQKKDRESFLHSLEKKIPGAYVPALHTISVPFQIKVQYLENLDKVQTHTIVLTSDTAFKNRFLIETMKGCPHGCRFCSAGYIYRPPRVYPARNIFASIDAAMGKTDKIGLVSSAIADHPDITDICDYALQSDFKVSFSSLRADKLSDKLIFALSHSKVKTATIAPEAGSPRMRNIINKKIEEQDILTAVQRVVTAGIMNLRLYFMIGLPFENNKDIHAIVELTKKIKQLFLKASQKNRKIGTITLSVNPFIPKPGTPFQWAAMEDETKLKQKVNIIKQGLKKIANVKVNIESLRKAKIHALLSRGDKKTSNIIESAVAHGWASAIKKNKAYCDSIIYEEKPVDAALPWDFLDNRVKKQFLAKEFLRAKQEKKSPACPMVECSICKTCI